MFRVVEGQDVFEIQSYLPNGGRVLFLLLALFPLLAPYELLIRPNWNSIWHLSFLFVLVISIGAMAVSAFLVWAAVAGLNASLRFDRSEGTFTYGAGAPIVRWKSQQGLIEDITDLRIAKKDWSDGGPSYALVIQMADGRTFKSGSSWSREEIEVIVRRVSTFLDISTQAL